MTRGGGALRRARGFPSGLDLVRDGDVDVVAVCTRVPDHREVVLAGLAAGQHVDCEWPPGSFASSETDRRRTADGWPVR